jgi:hypothetical protein
MHDDKTQDENTQTEPTEKSEQALRQCEPRDRNENPSLRMCAADAIPRAGERESAEEPERKTRNRRMGTKRLAGRQISLAWAIRIVAIVVIITAAAVYLIVSNTNKTESGDADMLAKLGSIMILPEGEDPVISTITDANGLKTDAPFYRNAENGDKILIYAESGKIIIYRESENLIINAGPIIDG